MKGTGILAGSSAGLVLPSAAAAAGLLWLTAETHERGDASVSVESRAFKQPRRAWRRQAHR